MLGGPEPRLPCPVAPCATEGRTFCDRSALERHLSMYHPLMGPRERSAAVWRSRYPIPVGK